MQVKHNRIKSDVFSFGMTVLHAANLDSNDECYDFPKGVINESMIEQRLKKMQDRYGPQITSVTRKMLSFNEENRPEFVDLSYIVDTSRQQSQGTVTQGTVI